MPAISCDDHLLAPRWRKGAPLALLLLVLLVYGNSFPATFIQDDIHIVLNNPLVKSFDLPRIFTSDYWYGIENSGLYRPLTILSFALNRSVGGVQPWGYHLVNVLLHAGVTILLWWMLPVWGARRAAAFIAAACFAIHPLHTEVLNIVVGRSELLAALFALLALYVAGRWEGRWPNLVVCLCLALALLSKEHSIVLLALLPLFDAHRAQTWQIWRRRWQLYLGVLTTVGLWLLMRQYGVDHVGPRAHYSATAVPLAYLTWDVRALTALQYQWVYLGKLFIPLELHAVYALTDLPPLLQSLWSPRALLVLGASLCLLASAAWAWFRGAWWALPLFAYAISFAPTSNIFMPVGVTMAERLAYFPSLWFCSLLGWGAGQLFESTVRWRNTLIGLLLCYVMILALRTGVRNRDFVSETTLWRREVTTNPNDYLGLQSYAESLTTINRYADADLAYQRLVKTHPEHQGGLRSYFAFLFGRGEYREAIVQAEAALRQSRARNDKVGEAYDLIDLATVYLELRDYTRALACLKAPEARYSEQPDFYYGLLGRAYQGLGEHVLAVESFALVKDYALDLNLPLYYANSLFSLGRLDEAMKHVREAIRLTDRPESWNLLGTILAQKRQFSEAAEAFAHACALAPEQQHYRMNLDKVRAILNQQAGSAQ